MMSDSLAAGVRHDHLLAIVALAFVLLCVVMGVASVLTVRRDDAESLAQLQVMATELRDHSAEGAAVHDILVDDELREQRWFRHEIEVWRGSRRVGGPSEEGRLRVFASHTGCGLGRVDGLWLRRCVVQAPPWQIVSVRPMGEILWALLPLGLSLVLVTLTATALIGVWSHRSLARRLAPLAQLGERLGALTGAPGERLDPQWGAREVDTLAATLNALLARVEGLVDRERRFIADASHELRTPLTRLRGQIEQTLSELPVEGVSAQSLRHAARTCHELSTTTEALLAMARGERHEDHTLDLAELCYATLNAVDEQVATRVQIVGADSAPTRGDEALLMLALGNALDNALKYSSGSVQIRVTCTDDRVAIQIEDEGPGLAPAELERVLAPFVRGRHVGRVQGAGLGLALAHHVARLHGGALTLHNQLEGGLCVVFTLPAWSPRARP